MKKIILICLVLFPMFSMAQAHLGMSFSDIKENYPDHKFESGVSDAGQKYFYTDFDLGTFVYYFDSATGLTDFCMQIPSSLQNLNAQVEIYNKKYVINSRKSWTAYLDGGGIMYINLVYNEDTKLYPFHYTSE